MFETVSHIWHAAPAHVRTVVFPAAATVLYILMIVFRKHLKMHIPLKFIRFHNASMIALAVIVLVGTLFGAYQRTLDPKMGGVAGLFCPPQGLASNELMTGTLGFFIYIFYLSKYVELVDTFILIAKGKDLLFLHCYHHCSMLFVTWSWFAFPWLEGAWWCAVVNSIIHSFMYYYYLRTATPGTTIWWGKYLTSAQIFQVFFHAPSFACSRCCACAFAIMRLIPICFCSFLPEWWLWPTLFTSATVPGTSALLCSPLQSMYLFSGFLSLSSSRSMTRRLTVKTVRATANTRKNRLFRVGVVFFFSARTFDSNSAFQPDLSNLRYFVVKILRDKNHLVRAR
jgi:fatty acid elongase 3